MRGNGKKNMVVLSLINFKNSDVHVIGIKLVLLWMKIILKRF